MVQECFQTGVMAMAIFVVVVIVGCLRAPRNETGFLSLEGVFFFFLQFLTLGKALVVLCIFGDFQGLL